MKGPTNMEENIFSFPKKGKAGALSCPPLSIAKSRVVFTSQALWGQVACVQVLRLVY